MLQEHIGLQIKYVETGTGVWMTLFDSDVFDGEFYDGKSIVISPSSATTISDLGKGEWMDLISSVKTSISPHLSEETATAIYWPPEGDIDGNVPMTLLLTIRCNVIIASISHEEICNSSHFIYFFVFSLLPF